MCIKTCLHCLTVSINNSPAFTLTITAPINLFVLRSKISLVKPYVRLIDKVRPLAAHWKDEFQYRCPDL